MVKSAINWLENNKCDVRSKLVTTSTCTQRVQR